MKRTLRNLCCIVLTLMLVITMTACGTSDNTNSQPVQQDTRSNANSSEPATITIWTLNRHDADYMNSVIQKINEEYDSSFLQLDISADFYNVAIVKINANEVSKSRNITKEELIHFFLFDIVGELFDSNIKTFAFGISDYQLGIIMCGCYEYKRQFFQNINKSLSKLIETMANYYHVTIFAAVGRIYEDILKLPLSFAEAKEAMTYSFAIEANTLINYDDIFLKKTETYEKPSSILKEIILYTKTGDSDKALKKIENLFEYYKGKAVLNPNLIKADVIEVVLAIQRYLEESKGDDTFLYNQNISPYEKIVKADSVSD